MQDILKHIAKKFYDCRKKISYLNRHLNIELYDGIITKEPIKILKRLQFYKEYEDHEAAEILQEFNLLSDVLRTNKQIKYDDDNYISVAELEKEFQSCDENYINWVRKYKKYDDFMKILNKKARIYKFDLHLKTQEDKEYMKKLKNSNIFKKYLNIDYEIYKDGEKHIIIKMNDKISDISMKLIKSIWKNISIPARKHTQIKLEKLYITYYLNFKGGYYYERENKLTIIDIIEQNLRFRLKLDTD